MPTRDGSGPDHEELLLLWGARRTGVLDALTTTAGTAEAVAAETGLDRETSARFVRTLAEYGYLRRVGDEYEPTNRALGFLATRDVRSIGATPRALDLVDSMARVGTDRDRHRSESASENEPDDEGTGERLRHRLGAHAATPTAAVRAGVTAAIHAAPDADAVVDVRGASGVYAAEFARRGYDVTLVESSSVLDVTGPTLTGRGVETVAAERVTVVPVETVGLATLAGVLQRHAPETNRALLASVHGALASEGVVVVLEPLLGRSPVGRRLAVERLAIGRGDAYTAERVEGWLREAGFVDVDTRDVPGTTVQAVVARRERGVD